MGNRVRSLCRSAVIAALYAAMTFVLAPLSFGAVQFRLAEALCVLPVLLSEAVPGLAAGCAIANLLCGAPLSDVLFGTLATLLAAVLTRLLRKKALPALAMPPLVNGLIVGPMVYVCYVMGQGAFSWGAMLFTALTVALGEAAAVFLPGLGLLRLLKRVFRKDDSAR